MKVAVLFARAGAIACTVGSGIGLAQVRVELPSAAGAVQRGPMSVSASIGATGLSVRIGRASGTAKTPPAPTSSSSRSTARASKVMTTANRYVGTKYVYGGTTPRGFDCSGFVQYVFRRHGVLLPRTSRGQATAGRRVAAGLSRLRVGDLLLFATKGKRIDHVAIYAGGNRIIHSSASGGGVRYDALNSKRGRWLVKHHVASRRVLSDDRRLALGVQAGAQ